MRSRAKIHFLFKLESEDMLSHTSSVSSKTSFVPVYVLKFKSCTTFDHGSEDVLWPYDEFYHSFEK